MWWNDPKYVAVRNYWVDFGFNIRVANALANSTISNLDELLGGSYLDLWRIPNISHVSIHHIVEVLNKKGIEHNIKKPGPVIQYVDVFDVYSIRNESETIEFKDTVRGFTGLVEYLRQDLKRGCAHEIRIVKKTKERK